MMMFAKYCNDKYVLPKPYLRRINRLKAIASVIKHVCIFLRKTYNVDNRSGINLSRVRRVYVVKNRNRVFSQLF